MGPNVIHKQANVVGAKQVRQKELTKGGIVMLDDIINPQGGIKEWESIQHLFWSLSCRNTYEKLIHNVDLSHASIVNVKRERATFMHSSPLPNGVLIWEFPH